MHLLSVAGMSDCFAGTKKKKERWKEPLDASSGSGSTLAIAAEPQQHKRFLRHERHKCCSEVIFSRANTQS